MSFRRGSSGGIEGFRFGGYLYYRRSTIYRQFLPYCDVAHVTRTDYVYEADAWFPNLDEDPQWEMTGQSEEKTYFDLEFTFCRYERKKRTESGIGNLGFLIAV